MAAAVLLTVLLVGLAACGGDDDDNGGAPGEPVASATPLTAAGLVPDLKDFLHTVPEKVAAPGGLDIVFSFFQKGTEPPMQARAEVRVYSTDDEAAADFPVQAQGWRNPPPDVFGIDLANEGAEPIGGVMDAVAYRATVTDGAGNTVWTDVYRIGRVVIVAHVLAREAEDAETVRLELAQRIREKLGQ
jgi:hypothetical protein